MAGPGSQASQADTPPDVRCLLDGRGEAHVGRDENEPGRRWSFRLVADGSPRRTFFDPQAERVLVQVGADAPEHRRPNRSTARPLSCGRAGTVVLVALALGCSVVWLASPWTRIDAAVVRASVDRGSPSGLLNLLELLAPTSSLAPKPWIETSPATSFQETAPSWQPTGGGFAEIPILGTEGFSTTEANVHDLPGIPPWDMGYDCGSTFDNWPAAEWSASKRRWCCHNTGKGCPADGTGMTYDCGSAYLSRVADWSPSKTAWCCQHSGKGCQSTVPATPLSTSAPTSTIVTTTTLPTTTTVRHTATTTVRTKEPAPHRPVCVAAGADCRAAGCCSGAGMRCYTRDEFLAVCQATCAPGVHPEDPEPTKIQWSCAIWPDGAASTEAPARAAPSAAKGPPEPPAGPIVVPGSLENRELCAADGLDCRAARCCKDPFKECFEKAKWWASCKTECALGVDPLDPPGLRDPWSCTVLGGQRPTPPPPKNITGPTSYLSLFCFAVASAHGGELQLLRNQYPYSRGIFGCDEWMVFSDQQTLLKDIPSTHILPDFAAKRGVPGALTATWVNAEDFIAAWDAMVSDGRFLNHDWILKSDPDAVILPDKLLEHLGAKFPNQAGEAMYLRSCQAGPRGLQLFGSVEVLSYGAVLTFGRNMERCKTDLDHAMIGEDFWLQKCLDLIGVLGREDFYFLDDGYCPSASPIAVCSPPGVAFHPFKLPESWSKCWNEAGGTAG